MSEAKQDKIQRIYSQLKGLRENLPNIHPSSNMNWPQVELYEKLLDKLEEVELSVDEFRIPSNLLKNQLTLANYVTGEMVDTGDPEVTEAYFKTQLDALLIYFQLGEGDDEETRVNIKL